MCRAHHSALEFVHRLGLNDCIVRGQVEKSNHYGGTILHLELLLEEPDYRQPVHDCDSLCDSMPIVMGIVFALQLVVDPVRAGFASLRSVSAISFLRGWFECAAYLHLGHRLHCGFNSGFEYR